MDLENFPTREMAKDMMGMISPIYDNSYVGKWIFEVMSVPLALARQTVDDLMSEAFPETATWSLPMWEQEYGIETNEALSIEERRKALVKKRNYKRPMNPYRIAQLVTEICGREAYVLENTAPHTYEICIAPGDGTVDIQTVLDAVYKVKQSQKHVRVVFETVIGVRIRAEPTKKVFPYRMAGTYPDVNNIGQTAALQINAAAEESAAVFPYVPTGTAVTGTVPDVSSQGSIETSGISTSIAGQSAGIVYKICGAKRLH